LHNKHARYFYTRLNDGQKLIYKNILQALYARQSSINIISQLEIGVILKIVKNVFDDNPELFYASENEIAYSYNGGHVIYFKYLHGSRETAGIINNINGRIKPLMQKTANYDKFEKEKELHDYLARNVKYNQAKSAEPVYHNITGALLEGTAVCSGYSGAFKYLCDLSGIGCIYVTGRAVNPDGVLENHAWNIVKIGGSCFHVDVTWNSCCRVNDDDCYDYYNISDAYMKKDHIWEHQAYPKCSLTAKIIPYITSASDFKEHIIEQVKNKNNNFSMRVNVKFKDEAELAGKIGRMLSGMPTFKSLGLRYNKNQDIINIILKG